MYRRTRVSMLGALLLAATWACLATNARCQSLDSLLNDTDKANLDLLASHTAQKIINADRTEPKPRVLVVDFFLGSPGVSSSLGTLLADHFSESLSTSSRKIKIIDRKSFTEYLTKNWTTLEDLKNFPGCLLIGRELGATGIVLGSVYEQNNQIALKIHLSLPNTNHCFNYPLFFNSASTSFATSFNVSNTPAPVIATPSSTGSPFFCKCFVNTSTGRAFGKSLLLSCSTYGIVSNFKLCSFKCSCKFSCVSKFASSRSSCESATNTTPSAPFKISLRLAS